ncbi:MarR family winged helix-turn-helix transcriptional regulator [Marivirga atlantica]|uniref:MarR family transcriptional regulator n=1 Tax=Marivirga atlantica TaxID=1548457 RepID=A0A937DKI3_9BACT|nr:MarR family transcriptional regulator [Marivirga atlantica]MBL0766266.1 MarR family transcriptional regulator [Marivirga atlantica]
MKIENVILFQIDKTSKIAKLYSQREFERLGMGITVEQWILLKIIEENDGLTQKELAAKSLRDPASITRTLDLLNKKEFVERRAVEDNRRQYSICLTRNGKTFIDKFMPIINNHRSKSIDGISQDELNTLNRLLEKIQQNMH